MVMDNEPREDATRGPETPLEWVTSNFRPMPALPAVIVFWFSLVVPFLFIEPRIAAAGGSDSIFLYLIPLGILASCGLAIAAGFCSFAPHTIWIVLALWGQGLVAKGALPDYNITVLNIGIFVTVLMIILQLWRVYTGKFVPTIPLEEPHQE